MLTYWLAVPMYCRTLPVAPPPPAIEHVVEEATVEIRLTYPVKR
jgi:hypothetical protein